MKKTVALLLSFSVAAALVGCGGGGGGGAAEPAPVAVVTAPVVLAAAPATTAAVANEPFKFPSGVTELGTTAPTTIVFSVPSTGTGTGTTTTPAFTITSETYTAKGTTTFGSCIFKITESTFPAGHKMATGNTITIHPCNIKVETAGMAVDAPTQERNVALVLGSAASTGEPVPVDVNPGGQLTLNGNSVGTVTITFVTGT
ncbi:hypothetical protein [Ramlibacter sp.]|uniref:hypothetical protein n=1 Tax=Ramlibacter sp. TaxID=1917967 RepID=UPI002C7C138C|nr:hypothetical protein [Ramlibacter sp.]HWI83888.1 hypothetical protein [Ramlibacter sp.]